MRRLSAKVFEMAAGARAWLPAEGTGQVAGAEEAALQPETYRKAYLEGFEEGFADGDKEARRALQEAQGAAHAAEDAARAEEERWCAALAACSKQFVQAQQEDRAQMEVLAVTIAFASICRFIGRMHAEHDLVATLCRETLEGMRLEPVRLRIAQVDLASFEESGLALPVVADPGLEPGDCVIETPLGSVEAGVEVKLRALMQTFLETLGRKEWHA